MIGGKNIPNDEKLYKFIKKKVKAQFQETSRWPSAYGSGFLVKEYKKAFKEKYGNKSPYKIQKKTRKSNKKSRKSNKKSKKSRKSNKNNLTRWFNEKWVNVCKKKSGKYAPCGRKKGSMKKYPYCRPLHRINKGTPMTVGEIKKKYGSKKLKSMCKKKNSKRDKKSMTYVKKSKKKSKKKSQKWSKKYKKSINCRKPKGFSQKQYCKHSRKKSRKKSRK